MGSIALLARHKHRGVRPVPLLTGDAGAVAANGAAAACTRLRQHVGGHLLLALGTTAAQVVGEAAKFPKAADAAHVVAADGLAPAKSHAADGCIAAGDGTHFATMIAKGFSGFQITDKSGPDDLKAKARG